MKRYVLYSFLLMGVLFFFSGCSKEDEVSQGDIIKGEDQTIPAALSSKVLSGRNRLLFIWPKPDEEIKKVKLYWNERRDSIVKEVKSSEDTLKISIDDLEEKTYSFRVLAFNEENKYSGEVYLEGEVYGESFVSDLPSRKIYDLNYLPASNEVSLIWDENPDKSSVGTEVEYADQEGNQVHRFFPPEEELEIKLKNVAKSKTGTIKYRTGYFPEKSIDTIYKPYKEAEYVNRKAVFESLSGWKFSCSVLAEAETIAEFGGPYAFKQKMDEKIRKSSKKFQVPGLNDQGGNEIYFYMTKFSAFEGSSEQYRYDRVVDSTDIDMLIIANNHADSDDLSWGWLGAPYLTLGHDYPGLFVDNAVDALAHEFGHARGMYDLYLGEVPEGKNNPINGEAFHSKRGMMKSPYGETVWAPFSQFIINASGSDKVAEPYWHYFPSDFAVEVKLQDGTPAVGAKLNFYPVFGGTNKVRENDVVKHRGTTNNQGIHKLPDNPFTKVNVSNSNNVYNYLIQIAYEGEKEYRWMPMDDVLMAGTEHSSYVFEVNLDQ